MKSRKGLSTVVGMVFALIALAISMGYITYSMNILDQYDKTVIAKNQQIIDNVKENFQLYSATITSSKFFNIAITNTGNLPITITKMWVQNYTVADSVNYYPMNISVPPGAKGINIGSCSTCPTVNPASNGYYNIKLVTARGNSLQFNMGSPGTNPLYMQLTFTPNSIKVGMNATLILVVINNATSNNLITNLQPKLPYCTGALTLVLQKSTSPTPTQYLVFPAGSMAIFKWAYAVSGNPGNNEKCTVGLVNGVPGNNGTDNIYFVS
jgi:hypothetical protein